MGIIVGNVHHGENLDPRATPFYESLSINSIVSRSSRCCGMWGLLKHTKAPVKNMWKAEKKKIRGEREREEIFNEKRCIVSVCWDGGYL